MRFNRSKISKVRFSSAVPTYVVRLLRYLGPWHAAKIYTGRVLDDGRRFVEVQEKVFGRSLFYPLPPREPEAGFDWGRYGTPCEELAYCLLADACSTTIAERYHQAFKREVVSQLKELWKLTSHDILTAVLKIQKSHDILTAVLKIQKEVK